jgi:AcrR family transcriptional regulator
VTTQTKNRTRQRILGVARRLFARKGFEQTTTRDLTSAVGIAAGTLFNYFPSKEALATTLVADTLRDARADYERRLRGTESTDEALFLLVVCGLRRLEPHRGYVGAVLETALRPFAESMVCAEADALRLSQLEIVSGILASHAVDSEPSPVAMHLYWTLYLGVLAFWSRDDSPNQEDTLALLDQSMRLFVASLTAARTQTEVIHDA